MKKFILSSTALALTMTAQSAFAQAAQGADEADKDDVIIVTARKREENLIDVPLAVSVATQAQLQRDQINSLTDLQRITPALEISLTSGGETNGGGRLRGLGTGVFNQSVASSVAYVVDQVPTGNLSFPQLFDISQVEVLRGPQGTLFGQGASAGVINVTTKRPKLGDYGANASIDFADKGSLGSEVGEFILNAGVNIPLGETAAVRFSTQAKTETGLQRSVTTGKDNKIKDVGVRGHLLWQPSETVKVNLTGQFARQTQIGQTFFAIAVTPNSTTPFGPPGGTLGGISAGAFLNPTGCAMPAINARAEFYCEDLPSLIKLNMSGLSAVVDFELSDSLTLTSVTGFRKRKFQTFRRDFSRITGAPAARQDNNFENSSGFNQELRLNYDGESVDIVGGAYYGTFKFENFPGPGPYTFGSNALGQRTGFSVCLVNGAFCPVPTSFTKERTNNRTIALFTDATFAVSETIDVFGGLRYSSYKNTTRVALNSATAPATGLGVVPLSESDISGRIGFSYKPSAQTNIYASYSRGYKPSAVGVRPPTVAKPGDIIVPGVGALFVLNPEKADAFELGAKFGVGRMQLSANIFYSSISNFQSQNSEFVGTALVSQPLNIAKINSKGFELSAFGKVSDNFSINAGYQFNIVKYPAGYCGDDDTPAAGCSANLGGTQFLNAPKHKFTLSGDYGIPIGSSIEAFVNANLVWKSKVLLAARADPRYRYPGHELINLGFGIRHPEGNWNASIFVRNLTKEREPTAYLASTFAGQADGGIRAWPVAGLTARVVGARVGFNF